ncbi:hypothetical protein AVEN_140721-1, partial [Araneus ventricosus]
EIEEYVKLFGGSPVGNFTRLTMTGVNEDFCVLDDYDQVSCFLSQSGN